MGGRGEQEINVSSAPKSSRKQKRQTCGQVLYVVDSTQARNLQTREFFQADFFVSITCVGLNSLLVLN